MPTLRQCPMCKADIPDDQPMTRCQVSTKRGRRWQWAWAPVCRECVERTVTVGRLSADGSSDIVSMPDPADPVPCATCGRPVIVGPDKRRKVITCSDLCRSRHYGSRRVEPAVTLTCEGCGRPMTGRSDKGYCSGACRQRAYRRRSRNAHWYVDAAEQADSEAMGAVTDATFEAALAEARAEGNLSRANVAAKCATRYAIWDRQGRGFVSEPMTESAARALLGHDHPTHLQVRKITP